MVDILIRGVADAALVHIDERATRQGLSRAEYLRRRIEEDAMRSQVTVTAADLVRLGELAGDLDDPEVMRAAWE